MLVIYNGVKHSDLLRVPSCSAQSRGNTRNNKNVKLGTTGDIVNVIQYVMGNKLPVFSNGKITLPPKYSINLGIGFLTD